MDELPEGFAEQRGTQCAECRRQTVDLTELGRRDLCPACFREAIADLELLPPAERNAGELDWSGEP